MRSADKKTTTVKVDSFEQKINNNEYLGPMEKKGLVSLYRELKKSFKKNLETITHENLTKPALDTCFSQALEMFLAKELKTLGTVPARLPKATTANKANIAKLTTEFTAEAYKQDTETFYKDIERAYTNKKDPLNLTDMFMKNLALAIAGSVTEFSQSKTDNFAELARVLRVNTKSYAEVVSYVASQAGSSPLTTGRQVSSPEQPPASPVGLTPSPESSPKTSVRETSEGVTPTETQTEAARNAEEQAEEMERLKIKLEQAEDTIKLMEAQQKVQQFSAEEKAKLAAIEAVKQAEEIGRGTIGTEATNDLLQTQIDFEKGLRILAERKATLAEGEATSAAAQIATLREELTNIKEKQEENEPQMAALRQKVTESEEEIETERAAKQEAVKQVKIEAGDAIALLQQKIVGLEEDNGRLKIDAKADKEFMQIQIESEKALRKLAEKKITSSTDELTEIQALLKKTQTESEAKIALLRTRANELEGELEEAKNENTRLKAEVGTLTTPVRQTTETASSTETTGSEIDDLRKQVTILQGQLTILQRTNLEPEESDTRDAAENKETLERLKLLTENLTFLIVHLTTRIKELENVVDITKANAMAAIQAVEEAAKKAVTTAPTTTFRDSVTQTTTTATSGTAVDTPAPSGEKIPEVEPVVAPTRTTGTGAGADIPTSPATKPTVADAAATADIPPSAPAAEPATSPEPTTLIASVTLNKEMDIFNKLPDKASVDPKEPTKISALTAAITAAFDKLKSTLVQNVTVAFDAVKHTVLDANNCKTEFTASFTKPGSTPQSASISLTRTAEADGKTTWKCDSNKKSLVSPEMAFKLIAEQSLRLRIEEKRICGEKIEALKHSIDPKEIKEREELQAKFDNFNPKIIAISVKEKGPVKDQTLAGYTFRATDEQKAAIEGYLKAGDSKPGDLKAEFTSVQFQDADKKIINFTQADYKKSLEPKDPVTEEPAPSSGPHP